MTTSERLDFLNFWYLLIILNDILIIVGSALKEQIENKVSYLDYLNQLTGGTYHTPFYYAFVLDF